MYPNFVVPPSIILCKLLGLHLIQAKFKYFRYVYTVRSVATYVRTYTCQCLCLLCKICRYRSLRKSKCHYIICICFHIMMV